VDPATAPVPPPRTPEEEAWLAQPDPYAGVGELITNVTGIGDLGGQWQAGQDAYAQGVPAPVPDKRGEAVVQDAVDLQHSGLGQAVGGLISGLRPFSATVRQPVHWGR
jgi:hypothetical protein